jgi:hypothetical protein
MGNANSGNVRDRHKSGDSLPPSSPCGIIKDGQAFSFDKRPSVGQSNQGMLSNPPSSPAAHSNNSVNNSQPPTTHHKIIQLQHSQSNEDEEPYFTRPQPISKSLSKDVSSVISFPTLVFCVVAFALHTYHLSFSCRNHDDAFLFFNVLLACFFRILSNFFLWRGKTRF